MGICANPEVLAGVIGRSAEVFFQPLEMMDDISCANLFFLFFRNTWKYQTIFKKPDKLHRFARHTGVFRRQQQQTPPPCSLRASHACPSNKPRFPQNLPCQQTEQGRNMAAPSPASALASSELPATAFSLKKRKSRKPVP